MQEHAKHHTDAAPMTPLERDLRVLRILEAPLIRDDKARAALQAHQHRMRTLYGPTWPQQLREA
jgi:hypothetical protein